MTFEPRSEQSLRAARALRDGGWVSCGIRSLSRIAKIIDTEKPSEWNPAIEEIAKVIDKERLEYEANSSRCLASGNSVGSLLDDVGALVCRRLADRVRALARPVQTNDKGEK